MSCCTLALNFLEQTRLLEFISKKHREGFIRLSFAEYRQRYGNTILLDKIQQLPMKTLV